MLSAEIIAVGSELLTPAKTDTNSLWLTEKLNEIGIELKLKTVVGDDRARGEEAIRDAVKRSNVVITTGGLGPTEDDMTRAVAAAAVGRELVLHQETVDNIRAKFARMQREMPEINARQGMVIDGADVLPNPNGTAPGMLFQPQPDKFLIILPGPPRELKPMFENFALPRLREQTGEVSVKRRVLRVAGMGESAVDEQIAPIYKAFENIQTSILFNRSEIEIWLIATARDESEADAMLETAAQAIADKLGSAVFAMNGEQMEGIIARLLTEQNKTLAVAESCTGGLVSQRLTEIPGSSKFFIEGIAAYSNESKIRNLNVPAELIEQNGAVSAQVAEAMARGIREKADTDFAISITGIAGPDGGTPEKPVGTVFLGLAAKDETKSRLVTLPGDRHLIRWRASQAALDLLRRQLLKQ